MSGVFDIVTSLYNTNRTNKNNLEVTQRNNDFQERMSRTSHQREVKDLKKAGLNPILSARSAGAPQPSSAAAKVEPYHLPKQDFLAKQMQVQQIKLLQAQSQKTRAEAVNTSLQEPYNQALSNLYGSVAGTPVVAGNAVGKATGAIASGFGLYKAGQAINRIRKSKVLPESKPLSNLQKQKLLKLHKLKTKTRNRYGLRPGEYIDKRTGEIKIRGKSGGGFSLRKGFGNRSGRYNKFNKF